MLLSDPTKGKLGPRWTGPWTVTAMKSPLTVALKMNDTERIVHINRVRPLLLEDHDNNKDPVYNWSPPLFHHEEFDLTPSAEPFQTESSLDEPPVVTTRSGRTVRPVKRYEPTL